MKMDMIEIAAIMVLAGIAGGTVNFALSRTEKSTAQDLLWAVAIGTGASFLMPLFLNTLSSDLLTNLLNESEGDSSDPFVFAGFCLLGAIASRAMIQTLTDKILKETKATQEKVSDLESAVAPILDKETEQDDEPALPPQGQEPLDDKLKTVLKALTETKFSMRSVSGITKDVARIRSEVIENLNELSAMGLASEVQGKKGKRWALTPSGRQWTRNT